MKKYGYRKGKIIIPNTRRYRLWMGKQSEYPLSYEEQLKIVGSKRDFINYEPEVNKCFRYTRKKTQHQKDLMQSYKRKIKKSERQLAKQEVKQELNDYEYRK